MVTSEGSSPSHAISAQLWNCASSGTPAPSNAIWKSTVSLLIGCWSSRRQRSHRLPQCAEPAGGVPHPWLQTGDRKSTRLNSSHVRISYAVFCLKKKNNTQQTDN